MKGVTLMKSLAVAFLIAAASFFPVGAQDLICSGNEPNWSITLTGADRAQVHLPNGRLRNIRGRETRNDPMKERVWRERGGQDTVLFLREGQCSDGMSDTLFPYFARVSLSDGSFWVGCCRLPGQSGEAGAIERSRWQLLSFTGGDGSVLATQGIGVTLQLENGNASGFSGCNRFTGPYTIESAGRIRIGSVAGTMMACPQGPGATVEAAFNRAIAGTHSYSIAGDRMTLKTESGAVMVFGPESSERLEGHTWKVTGYNNQKQAVVSPVTGTELTISFANGRASGQAGCNAFQGPFKLDGGGITIGPLATSRKMCMQTGVMEQETQFLKSLETAVRFIIYGRELNMYRADGERVLTANPR